MILCRVTATDYRKENGETVVQLSARASNGRRITREIHGTIPYFYTREEDAARVADHEGVTTLHNGYESFDDVPLTRVDLKNPSYAGRNGSEENLVKGFEETWESDIPFYRRCSLDYNLSGHIRVPDQKECHIDDIETNVEIDGDDIIEPRIFIADIEVPVDDDTTFDELREDYDRPISHFTIWDSYEDEYIVLHLDPDSRVDPNHVGSLLDAHIGTERMKEERQRDITLRSYKSADALLTGFLRLLDERRPDLVSGWNFVDFDWDYILNHMRNVELPNGHSIHDMSDVGWVSGHAIERMVDCVPAFDQMDAYCEKMMFSEPRSKSLDYIAKKELGEGKVPHVDISWAFENARDKLVAYNIIDVMLCVSLDRREGIHEFFYELAELSQIQIYDTFSEMRLVDGYIMSQGDNDEVLPSMPEDNDIPENDGGLVLDPSDGVKEWVGTIDLKSLYPSAIITWNISPETIHWYEEETPEEFFNGDPDSKYLNIPWLPDADHAEGGDFGYDEIDFDVMWVDMTREGLIPKYIKKLFPERERRKEIRDQYEPGTPMYEMWDRKQRAVKVIMNSFYGVMSNDWWRLGEYGLGDAVTSTSRYSLWQGKHVTEQEGYEVYYGDTDSIMVSLAARSEEKDVAVDRGFALEDAVNSGMDECVRRSGLADREEHPFLTGELHGTDRHCLVYEFEKLYRRFFQAGSKKRYAGSAVWIEGNDVDSKIDTVGFEAQRSDSPEMTEEVQPEIINMILSGDGFNEVSEFVQELIEDFDNREIEMYKVALPGTLNDALEEYGNTQTARACRFSNDNLGYSWSEGDDPWLYFVRKTPPLQPGTDIIALDWDDEIPDEFELDDDAIFDRALKGPLLPILREVNWRWEEVKHGAQTQSAADASWEVDDDTKEENNDWGW